MGKGRDQLLRLSLEAKYGENSASHARIAMVEFNEVER